MMKKQLFPVALFIAVSMLGIADNTAPPAPKYPPSGEGKKVLFPGKPDPRRPTAPSRIYMEGVYGAGYLYLEIPQGSYYVTVQLFNDSFEWTGLATTEQPLVELPDDLAGKYTIICRTDDGRVFSGTLEF